MTIRIGTPTTPRGITLGSTITTTFKIAGLAAVAYGAATGLGIFAELANYKEVATTVCDLMAPALKLTNAVYGALGNAAGLGEAIHASPPVDPILQLAGSGIMATVIGGVLSMVGTKLTRQVEQKEADRAERTAQPGAHAALATLSSIKSRWTSGVSRSAQHDDLQAPTDADQPLSPKAS